MNAVIRVILNRRARVLLSVAVAVLLAVTDAASECVPENDPCAPKKKIGEWDVNGLFGFNLTRGNSETLLVNLGATANYEKDENIFESSISYNFGEDEAEDDEDNGNTTRNDVRAGGQYSRLLDERWFVGFGTTLLYDEIADIDYRVNLIPSGGYYFLKDNTYKLRLEAGPGYIFERQGSLENDYFSPRIADRFEWALTCTSKLFQQAEVLFDVSDSENYIVNAEFGVEAALATSLALVFTVRDYYDNVPAEDRDRNDLQAITALKVAL